MTEELLLWPLRKVALIVGRLETNLQVLWRMTKMTYIRNGQKTYSRKNPVTEESLLSPLWKVVAILGHITQTISCVTNNNCVTYTDVYDA